MNGTWRTTGARSSAIPALVAVVLGVVVIAAAVEWMLARIWWIVGGGAVLAVAVILIVRWLMRSQQRREAAYGDRRAAINHNSTSYEITGTPRRDAIAAPVHIHFHGLDPGDAAEAVRRAIGDPPP